MSRLERIVTAWGGLVMDGGRRALVRAPGHGPHDRSVSLLETEDGRLIIHCFSPQEDWRAIRDALLRSGLLSDTERNVGLSRVRAPPPPQPSPDAKTVRAASLWTQSRLLRGSAAESYLFRRAIHRRSWNDDVLRCHRAASSIDDRIKRPALVAAIRGADGGLQGIQLTLLTRYGERKAHVPTPRRIIGRALGGAVQLDSPGDTLLVAEGVETALSAAEHFDVPAWALLSSSLMARFEPPDIVRRLVIAADDDEAGREAADSLASRLRPGISVEIARPEDGFKDWNDRAMARDGRGRQ